MRKADVNPRPPPCLGCSWWGVGKQAAPSQNDTQGQTRAGTFTKLIRTLFSALATRTCIPLPSSRVQIRGCNIDRPKNNPKTRAISGPDPSTADPRPSSPPLPEAPELHSRSIPTFCPSQGTFPLMIWNASTWIRPCRTWCSRNQVASQRILTMARGICDTPRREYEVMGRGRPIARTPRRRVSPRTDGPARTNRGRRE